MHVCFERCANEKKSKRERCWRQNITETLRVLIGGTLASVQTSTRVYLGNPKQSRLRVLIVVGMLASVQTSTRAYLGNTNKADLRCNFSSLGNFTFFL
jgi:uncharacterized membrane protein